MTHSHVLVATRAMLKVLRALVKRCPLRQACCAALSVRRDARMVVPKWFAAQNIDGTRTARVVESMRVVQSCNALLLLGAAADAQFGATLVIVECRRRTLLPLVRLPTFLAKLHGQKQMPRHWR